MRNGVVAIIILTQHAHAESTGPSAHAPGAYPHAHGNLGWLGAWVDELRNTAYRWTISASAECSGTFKKVSEDCSGAGGVFRHVLKSFRTLFRRRRSVPEQKIAPDNYFHVLFRGIKDVFWGTGGLGN